MIRAVIFDFYSVWAPEKVSEYLALAAQESPEVIPELQESIQKYYLGTGDAEYLANTFKFKLNRTDIEPAEFELLEKDISPVLIEFMRGLHEHFLKLAIFANLGKPEYELLCSLNQKHQLFEVITGPIVIREPLLSQAAFAKALQAIGEPPQACILVSGNQEYLNFAKGMGLQIMPYIGFSALQKDLPALIVD